MAKARDKEAREDWTMGELEDYQLEALAEQIKEEGKMQITKDNYTEGRNKLSRGEVTVPTYYYALRHGDKAQLIRQGNSPYRVRKISGLCLADQHLTGNIYVANGYYYCVTLT